MGRRKIVIHRLENETLRKATFQKRRFGLFKKAMELSLLTGCEIALVVFDMDGTPYQYASNGNAHSTLVRFVDCQPVEKSSNADYFTHYAKRDGEETSEKNAQDENAEKDEEQSSEAHGPRQALDIANQKGLPNVEDLTRGISKEAPPEEKIAAASRRVAEVWAKAGPRQTGSIVPDDDPLKEHSQDSMADIHGKREREINKEPHGKRQKVDNEVVGSQGIGGETSIGAARTDSGLRKRQLRVSIPEKNSAPPSAGLQPPARKRDIAMNEGNLDGSNTGQPAGRDVLTSSTGSTTRLPPFEPFPSGRLDLSDFSGNGLTPSLSMNPFAFSGRGAMGFPFSGIFSASSMAPPQWPDSGRRDSHTHGQMQGNGRRSGAHNSMQVQEGLPGQLFPHGPDSARAKEVTGEFDFPFATSLIGSAHFPSSAKISPFSGQGRMDPTAFWESVKLVGPESPHPSPSTGRGDPSFWRGYPTLFGAPSPRMAPSPTAGQRTNTNAFLNNNNNLGGGPSEGSSTR